MKYLFVLIGAFGLTACTASVGPDYDRACRIADAALYALYVEQASDQTIMRAVAAREIACANATVTE